MESGISKDYEIRVPKQVEMQIIITDMDFKLPEKDLIDKLKKQNGVLENSEMKVIKIFETRRKGRTIFNARMKIHQELYNRVFSCQRVNIGWERYRVYNGTEVTLCYKCLGYNHRAAEYRNEEVCFKCHGNHKSRDCSKESMNKCFNCIRENRRLNFGLDENHVTNHRDCPVYLNKLSISCLATKLRKGYIH